MSQSISKWKCKLCENEYYPDPPNFQCPNCGSLNTFPVPGSEKLVEQERTSVDSPKMELINNTNQPTHSGSKSITVLTIILLLGLAGATSYLAIQYRDKTIEIESLNNALSIQHQEMTTEIESLDEALISKENQISRLQTYWDNARQELTRLRSDYSQAQTEISRLESQNLVYSRVYELHIGNSLTSFYEKIREEYTPTSARTERLIQKKVCQFAAQLALHDLGELTWPDIEDQYKEDVNRDSCDDAYDILNDAFGYCDINNYDSNSVKVKKILDFVNSYIDYEYDVEDTYRAPAETLNLRSGDCDDYSVLTAALLELADIRSAVGYFTDSESDMGHFMVLVNLDDLGGYSAWFFDDLSSYGLSDGKWVLIEPQRTIEYQGDEEWMSKFTLNMAIEIDYEHATS